MDELQQELFDILEFKLKTGKFTRREFLQTAALFGLGSVATAFLGACGGTQPPPAPTAGPAGVTAAPPSTSSVRFLIAEMPHNWTGRSNIPPGAVIYALDRCG